MMTSTSGCGQATPPSFLGLEPLIFSRLLKTVRPLGVQVLSAADIVTANEAALPTPSVRCTYYGHEIIDSGPTTAGMAVIEQTWIVISAVRNVYDLKGGAALRAETSPVVDAVWDALDGWRPEQGYSALKSVTPPEPAFMKEGCLYIPLAFTTRFRRQRKCA